MEENLNEPKSSVWSIGLKFGVILAVVNICFMLVRTILGDNPYGNDWKNWLGAVFTIVIVVLAHKNFKDNGDGYMSYGQGLGLSMVVILVSIVIGGVFSFVYNMIDPTVMENAFKIMAEEMEAKGQNEEQVAMAMEWTKKLFWVFYFVGGIFMGFIIGLIVSIFTQKSNPEFS